MDLAVYTSLSPYKILLKNGQMKNSIKSMGLPQKK